MVIAYIDAGMGAMLLQWIIALVIGSGIFFRNAIRRFFRRLIGKSTAKAEPAEDETGKNSKEKK